MTNLRNQIAEIAFEIGSNEMSRCEAIADAVLALPAIAAAGPLLDRVDDWYSSIDGYNPLYNDLIGFLSTLAVRENAPD